MHDNSIGLRLQKLREARGLSQDEVAEACGMSRVALTRYENGTRIPQTRYAAQLAAFYHVTVNYIMGMEESIDNPAQQDIAVSLRAEAHDMLEQLSDENYQAMLTILRTMVDKKR